MYDKEKGILGFAYEKWNYNYSYNYYYSSMEQGFAVFNFDTEAENDQDKLVYRGTLTNISSEVDINYNYNYYYDNYWSFVTRGIFSGDYIYTISDRYITSYDMVSLTEVDKINILEE